MIWAGISSQNTPVMRQTPWMAVALTVGCASPSKSCSEERFFVIIIALSLQPIVLLSEEMGASHVVPLKIGPHTLYLQNIKLLLQKFINLFIPSIWILQWKCICQQSCCIGSDHRICHLNGEKWNILKQNCFGLYVEASMNFIDSRGLETKYRRALQVNAKWAWLSTYPKWMEVLFTAGKATGIGGFLTKKFFFMILCKYSRVIFALITELD